MTSIWKIYADDITWRVSMWMGEGRGMRRRKEQAVSHMLAWQHIDISIFVFV